jgi:hypothetical protein
VTLARAGRDYAGVVAAEKLAAESESAKELAARIDTLRAAALAKDPDAAEFYGFELPEAEPDQAELDNGKSEEQAGGTNGDRGDPSKLDAKLEEALRHPQVRQAIDQEIAEVHKARQGYLEGLTAAAQIAQVSFISQFPELAAIAPENLPGALEQLSRQDPGRFARVQATVANTEQLFARQHQENRRQAEMDRQNFVAFARSEDARLDTMLKGEPKETQRAVTEEIMASASESGIERGELMRLFHSEPLMRNAVFQRMMYDAGKYRLMMKARDAAAAKPVPPVQRPGTVRTPAERENADMRTLTARLASSGDIKDAVALYHARKSSRR